MANRRIGATGIVAALHLLFAWFLCSGPVMRPVEVIPNRRVEVHLLEAEAPPPRPEPLRVAVSMPALPPPPFVPPPDIQLLAPPETAILASDVPHASPAGTGKDATAQPSGRGRAASGPVSTPPQIDFNRCGKPAYPEINAQGTTLILFTMDATGAISDAEVAEPSGPSRRHRALDRLAREFVLSCRGTPGTVNGQAVPLRGLTPITWRLAN